MDDENRIGPGSLGTDVSRRTFVAATGAALATGCSGGASMRADDAPPEGRAVTTREMERAPFDSLRDYIKALEQRGLVLRIDRVDQDAYEGTALMYRLVDRFGRLESPVVVFERVRIDGRWIDGPVVCNVSGPVDVEAIMFGLEPVPNDSTATYHRARKYLDEMLERSNGQYPQIAPIEVERLQAPCKQVTLIGDDIDVTAFPFLQNNPGDSGRFINTTSVFTSDAEMGLNIGTYRCQINGPREIIVGTGEGQTGFNMLMAAKGRGEKTARIALVCGQDPMTWLVSGARIPERRGKKPVDELAYAGGLRGKALEVVKCDTNELRVPAHAEMVIEGIVSLEGFEPNGPYGESPGYIGEVYEKAFFMDVTRITHRTDPWFMNDFTGITKALISMPSAALTTAGLKAFIPSIVDYRWRNSVTFIAIKKTRPGEALDVGKRLAKLIPIFKIVVMVDDDVDLWNGADWFMAFATRWQAYPASHIFEDLPVNPLEPSAPVRERSSKIVIDATRQWPEEGGPETFPAYSRHVLRDYDPEVFDRVDKKWWSVIDDWTKS
ncbi:MAG: UbiD family decarboxylase domain-containing protein [Gammaproteobacteria bacterium]